MDDTISQMVAFIHQSFPAVQGIYWYGSLAAGQGDAASDWDLAVLASHEVAPETLFETAQRMAAVVKREVDLVDLRSASTVFQFEVVSQGRRIDTRDAASCGAFEDYVYKSYAKLNEERREILQDIQERGTIF